MGHAVNQHSSGCAKQCYPCCSGTAVYPQIPRHVSKWNLHLRTRCDNDGLLRYYIRPMSTSRTSNAILPRYPHPGTRIARSRPCRIFANGCTKFRRPALHMCRPGVARFPLCETACSSASPCISSVSSLAAQVWYQMIACSPRRFWSNAVH